MTPDRARGNDSSNETREATHYVLGDARVGIAIAEQLRTAGHRVAIIDDSYESSGIPGFAGDPAAVDVLEDAGVETASTVIVVTETDRRNLLIAQLVRTRFDVSRVIVFVHDPDRVSLFTNAGHETFCVTSALAQACSKSI